MNIINRKLFGLIIGCLMVLFYIEFAFCEDICKGDKECLEFEKISDAGKTGKIINYIDSNKKYSEGARFYIGLSYSHLALRENNRQKKIEYLLSAIKYGFYDSYMDIFNLYIYSDKEKAFSYLYEYEKINPKNSDLYFFLGEYEFNNGNIEKAYSYLKKSKKYSESHSAGLDWLLFKVSYLLGDYPASIKSLEEAMSQGRFEEERKNLTKDPRFKDIAQKNKFKRYFTY